jgi:hypothetical protein
MTPTNLKTFSVTVQEQLDVLVQKWKGAMEANETVNVRCPCFNQTYLCSRNTVEMHAAVTEFSVEMHAAVTEFRVETHAAVTEFSVEMHAAVLELRCMPLCWSCSRTCV